MANRSRSSEGLTDTHLSAALDSRTAGRVLNVGFNDKLHITWGAIVSQSAGACFQEFEAVGDSHMFLFVNKGVLHVRVGSEELLVSPGQTLLIWPGERCLGIEPHKTDFLCQWLSFVVERSRRSRQDTADVPRTTVVTDPGTVGELFRLLIEEYHKHQSKHRNGKPLSTPGSQLLLLSLLSRLDTAEPEERQPSTAPAVLAERARNHMRANPGAVSSIADLAKMLDCSVGYLRTAFRSTYGYSPMACLRGFRMYEARSLLLNTPLAIGDIARRCGYISAGHFTRVFTREHGISPIRYRIAHRHQYKTPGI